MATIKGIEVSGTIYDTEDETARTNASSALSTATTAETKATTAQTTAETAQETAETAQETAETADEKIGDLTDLETTVKTNVVSALNEVDAKAEEANKTSIFDFLTLIFGSYNASAPLMGADDSTSFVGNIPNYASYKGVAIICADSQYTTNSQSGRTQGRELKFLTKRADGTCEIQLMQFIGGEREVTVYQDIRITSAGQITIYPGFAAKQDSDSDSTTSHYLFGVYAVYGIK